jgi:hypothetical protein
MITDTPSAGWNEDSDLLAAGALLSKSDSNGKCFCLHELS